MGQSDFASRERNRRRFLYGLGASLGSVALTALMADEQKRVCAVGPSAWPPHGPGDTLHLSDDGRWSVSYRYV